MIFLNKFKKNIIKILLMLIVILYWTVGTLESKTILIISSVFLGILVIIILNIDKMIAEKKNKNGAIWYAVFFTGMLVIRWNPLRGTKIKSFDRIIGQCTTVAIDVSKRIHNFYFWFIGTAVVFLLFYIGANYYKNKDNYEKNKTMMNLLDKLIIIGDILLIFRIIPLFNNSSTGLPIYTVSIQFLSMIIIAIIAYIQMDLNKKIEFDNFIKLIIIIGTLAIFGAVLLSKDWKSGQVLLWIQILGIFVMILGIKLIPVKSNTIKMENLTNLGVITCAVIPFCLSFYIEMIIILNQHHFFVDHLRRWYFVFGILSLILMGGIVCGFLKKDKLKDWRKWTYPILIVGMACLYGQIPISGIYNADIFESANYSVLISDFFQYGKIPIIEHYGGHMLTDVLEGIIYGILNNDFWGAIFSPYRNYFVVILVILFYAFLKHIMERDIAMAIVLFTPLYGQIQYWGLGILVCLALLWYVKNHSSLSGFVLWGSIIVCALYRLDLGYAFGLAAIATIILLMLLQKENRRSYFTSLGSTFVLWIGIGGIIWGGVCLWKKINPIDRLIEFLKISSSNQNWAYSAIGDTNKFAFPIMYIVIPFATLLAMVYLILHSKKYLKNEKKIWILLLVLGFSYFFDFPRGIVRHSLLEGEVHFNWTAFLFLALFIALVLNQKKVFIPLLAVFIIGNTLIISDESFNWTSIADISIEKIGSYTNEWKVGTYWEKIKENKTVIKRVNCDENLKEKIEDYESVINELLERNETYVDFSNNNFIYSAIGKENPVYISQSPGQLSGELAQEYFIKEMKNIPIVVMPVTNDDRLGIAIDGIANTYRYYKVSEYIYQNYRPLCKVRDRYVVWCLKDRYDIMKEKVEEMERGGQDIINNIIENVLNVNSHAATMKTDSKNNLVIKAIGSDPYISEIEKVFDIDKYIGETIEIVVDYDAQQLSEGATIDMYYTTEDEEGFSEDKVQKSNITNEGKAYFRIPITAYTKLRVDIPDNSIVTFHSLKLDASICQKIDYGYDGTCESNEGLVHNYDLGNIPQIWAEMDEKKCTDNTVLQTATENNGIYSFNIKETDIRNDGNYLKLTVSNSNNEESNVQLKLGDCINGSFDSKYMYSFVVKSGKHDYIFRISSDYYWYNGKINSCIIREDANLSDVKMQILVGD